MCACLTHGCSCYVHSEQNTQSENDPEMKVECHVCKSEIHCEIRNFKCETFQLLLSDFILNNDTIKEYNKFNHILRHLIQTKYFKVLQNQI